MSAEEMSNIFDVKLNSYVNQRNYGNQQGDTDFTCNEYEKSLFLTRAQEEVVLSLYIGQNSAIYPALNVFMKAFENTEKIKRELSALVKEDTINPTAKAGGIPFTSNISIYDININDDAWFIIYEGCKYKNDENNCIPEYYVPAHPITHDELDKIVKNPFKGPNKRRVLRLDIDTHTVELISRYPLDEYFYRYLSKPSPIITTDLPTSASIDGFTTQNDCELSTSIHNTIVDIAVQIAYQTKVIGRQSATQSS